LKVRHAAGLLCAHAVSGRHRHRCCRFGLRCFHTRNFFRVALAFRERRFSHMQRLPVLGGGAEAVVLKGQVRRPRRVKLPLQARPLRSFNRDFEPVSTLLRELR
jgi:hypothetical protein